MAWPQLPHNMPIFISGGSTAKTDYQVVNFTIPYLRGMNADFSDCRFNDADGNEISYVREGYTSGTTSKFSFLLPSHPTDGQVIYLFWGDSSLSDNSDPANVYHRQITNCEGAWDARFGSSTSLPDRSGNDYDSTSMGAGVTLVDNRYKLTGGSGIIYFGDVCDMGTDDFAIVATVGVVSGESFKVDINKMSATDGYEIYCPASYILPHIRYSGTDLYAAATWSPTSDKIVALASYDRDGNLVAKNSLGGSGTKDISSLDGDDIQNAEQLHITSSNGYASYFYNLFTFRKSLSTDEQNDLLNLNYYPYATPDIANTVNIVAARDDSITASFLESTFYTNDNRGFKPPFGARLRRDFPWPRFPVGIWLANNKGGTTLYDLSGNGNDGTITGGTWENGRLKMDGTGDIDMGSGSSLNITDAITIFAFLHFTDLSTNHVLADNSDGSGGYKFEITTSDLQSFSFTGNSAFTEAASSIDTVPTVVAVTCDASAGRLWTNGVLVKEAAGQTGTSSTAGLKILDGFKGYADLFVIVPIALDTNLIKFLSAFLYSEMLWDY